MEIAVGIVLLVGLLIAIASTFVRDPYFYNPKPAEAVVDLILGLFGGWQFVAALVLCLLRSPLAGATVALLKAGTLLYYFSIPGVTERLTEFHLGHVLLPALIAFVLALVAGPVGRRPHPRALQIAEGVMVTVLLHAATGVVWMIHEAVGAPLYTMALGETTHPKSGATPLQQVALVVSLCLGVGAVVVFLTKKSRALFGILLVAQATVWFIGMFLTGDLVLQESLYYVLLFLLAFLVWMPSVGRWFATPGSGFRAGPPGAVVAPAPTPPAGGAPVPPGDPYPTAPS